MLGRKGKEVIPYRPRPVVSRVAPLPEDALLLTQLEGHWEVPVRWCSAPLDCSLVVSLQPSAAVPTLAQNTVFALQSAFASRAELERFTAEGWALVRAYPLNAPQLLQASPGYKTEEYILCALTTPQMRTDPSIRPAPSRMMRELLDAQDQIRLSETATDDDIVSLPDASSPSEYSIDTHA